MSSSNTITAIGTIATAPRLIATKSGVSICSFRLASGDRRYDTGQQKWVDGETNWFTITSFRSLADHAAVSFQKGQRVFVTGKLRIRQWENGEKSGIVAEIDADALGHDLRFGVSQFDKRVGKHEDAKSEENEPATSGWASESVDSDPRGADGFVPAVA